MNLNNEDVRGSQSVSWCRCQLAYPCSQYFLAYIVLSLLETTSELYTRSDKRWESVANTLSAIREITSSRLQKLVCQLDFLLFTMLRRAYLKLDGQIVRLEQVYHPSYPSLLFRQLPIIDSLSSSRSARRGRILLVPNQDGTETKDTRYVVWVVDKSIVLQD